MNRKWSTLLSVGISAVLIGAGIWFLFASHRFPWHEHHLGGGISPHFMMGGGMGITMILFWILIIAASIGLIRAIFGTGTASPRQEANGRNGDDPVTILQRRYARGEIDRQEYEARLVDLQTIP